MNARSPGTHPFDEDTNIWVVQVGLGHRSAIYGAFFDEGRAREWARRRFADEPWYIRPLLTPNEPSAERGGPTPNVDFDDD
jgi:hypothetical protein